MHESLKRLRKNSMNSQPSATTTQHYSETHASELLAHSAGSSAKEGSQMERELNPLLAELAGTLHEGLVSSEALREKLILGGWNGLSALNFKQLANEASIWLDEKWTERFPAFASLLQNPAERSADSASLMGAGKSTPPAADPVLTDPFDDLTAKLEESGPLTVVVGAYSKTEDFHLQTFGTFTLDADLVHRIKLKSDLSNTNQFKFITSDSTISFGHTHPEPEDISTDSAGLVVGQNAMWFEYNYPDTNESQFETLATNITTLIEAANTALKNGDPQVLLVHPARVDDATEFLRNLDNKSPSHVVRERQ